MKRISFTPKRPSLGFWLTLWIGVFAVVLIGFVLFLFPPRLDVDPESYVGLYTADAQEKAYREYVALVAKNQRSEFGGACPAIGRESYRGSLTREPCGVPRLEAARERLRIVKVVIVNNKITEVGW